jgi:hypothetical protein
MDVLKVDVMLSKKSEYDISTYMTETTFFSDIAEKIVKESFGA